MQVIFYHCALATEVRLENADLETQLPALELGLFHRYCTKEIVCHFSCPLQFKLSAELISICSGHLFYYSSLDLQSFSCPLSRLFMSLHLRNWPHLLRERDRSSTYDALPTPTPTADTVQGCTKRWAPCCVKLGEKVAFC